MIEFFSVCEERKTMLTHEEFADQILQIARTGRIPKPLHWEAHKTGPNSRHIYTSEIMEFKKPTEREKEISLRAIARKMEIEGAKHIYALRREVRAHEYGHSMLLFHALIS